MTYKDVFIELSDITDKFTLDYGQYRAADRSDIQLAANILNNYYDDVENKSLDYINNDADGVDYVIRFSNPISKIESVTESMYLREDDDVNSMIELMKYNDQFQDEPYVGIFWYDASINDLYGVVKTPADEAKYYLSADLGKVVRTTRALHADTWRKEYCRKKDLRFDGEYTKKYRGRVFEFKDSGFKVCTGKWINRFPQARKEILYEFQLPEDTEFIIDSH